MDRDDHTRLKLTAAMQELLNRIQRGSLDPIPEVPPERKRHKFGLIQGGKAGAIVLGAGTAVRYLREHGTAAGTAAAIAVGAALVYGIASGPERPAVEQEIGAPPPSVQLTSAPVTSPVTPAGQEHGEATTAAAPMPAPVIAAPSTTAQVADPPDTPRPTATSVPAPSPSPTDLPTATAWPTPSADPTPSATPSTTAPTPTPAPTPSATPAPEPDEPPEDGPRLCLRIRPILRICVGR